VPNGTVGEIVVFGDNVMTGYGAGPDEVAAAVRAGKILKRQLREER
jgi:acyl-CoA synthetase (AMP-forming)/AMP-acid ligase II